MHEEEEGNESEQEGVRDMYKYARTGRPVDDYSPCVFVSIENPLNSEI